MCWGEFEGEQWKFCWKEMISENKNTFLIRLMKPVLLIYHNVGMVFHPFSLPHLVFHSLSFLSALFSFFSSIFLSSSLFLSLLFLSGTKNKKRLYSTTEEKKGAKECGKKGVEEGKEKLKEAQHWPMVSRPAGLQDNLHHSHSTLPVHQELYSPGNSSPSSSIRTVPCEVTWNVYKDGCTRMLTLMSFTKAELWKGHSRPMTGNSSTNQDALLWQSMQQPLQIIFINNSSSEKTLVNF